MKGNCYQQTSLLLVFQWSFLSLTIFDLDLWSCRRCFQHNLWHFCCRLRNLRSSMNNSSTKCLLHQDISCCFNLSTWACVLNFRIKASAVPLMHHDPRDLGSLFLIRIFPKECTFNLWVCVFDFIHLVSFMMTYQRWCNILQTGVSVIFSAHNSNNIKSAL